MCQLTVRIFILNFFSWTVLFNTFSACNFKDIRSIRFLRFVEVSVIKREEEYTSNTEYAYMRLSELSKTDKDRSSTRFDLHYQTEFCLMSS